MGGMTRLLLLLLWAGVTVGRVVDLQKRIIGGRDCTNTERGYHVFLKINGEPFCSGSLISKDWILTAAHCWEPEEDDEVQIAGYKSSALPGHYNDDSLIDFSKPLQCAKSKVVDCGVFCPPKNSTYVYPHLLCFQDATVDISSGDSGGGLVYHGMIYGVNVLSANATCRGSAKSMDVCEKSYLTWIKTTAGIP
ncbi:serine protease 1-like isoform X2 [Cebidichthys violaceus]|uniref:serine protease 1-like isoform X2 n=1 Tax=Cebidichthys violaceus TaxID=271503 RepID=UPI0035CA8C77